MKRFLVTLPLLALLLGCDAARQIATTAGLPTSAPPTTEEVARGLKEALTIGSANASSRLGSVDGYLRNTLVKILLPPEAQKAEAFVRNNGGSLGNKVVDDLLTKMNRAAEQAAANPRTKEIFRNAVTSMTITDAWNILRGDSTAATRYLQGKTQTELTDLFAPVIGTEMDKAGVQQAWSQFSGTYNKLTMLSRTKEQLPTDISRYVTTRALNGLYATVAQEEAKIRKDPAARVTELLRRVFSYK